jgi:hypothetical protein
VSMSDQLESFITDVGTAIPAEMGSRQIDVVIVAGGLGAGKTQLVVQQCLQEAEKACMPDPPVPGRQIYINFPVDIEKVRRDCATEGHPEVADRIHIVNDLYGFLANRRSELQLHPLKAEDEGRDILFLDEAWEYANSRRSLTKSSIDFVDYMRIARKLGFEVMASMQLKSSVDKVIRVLGSKNVLAERHYYTDTVEKKLKSYYEYTLWWSEGSTTFYIMPEQSKKIHEYYLTTQLQAPGQASLDSMVGTPEFAAKDEQDLMRQILEQLKRWDARMQENPFLKMGPKRSQRLYAEVKELKKDVKWIIEKLRKKDEASLPSRPPA